MNNVAKKLTVFTIAIASLLAARVAYSGDLEDFLAVIDKGNENGAETNDELVNKTVASSIELVNSKEYKQAVTLLVKELRALRNPNPVLLAALANALLAQGKAAPAITVAEKSHALKSDYDWPLNLLANAYIREKKFDQAKQAIVKLKPIGRPLDILILQGDYYRGKGNMVKADSFYASALAANPQSESIQDLRKWNLHAAIDDMIARKDWSAALSFLDKIEQSYKDFDTHQMRAQIYALQKKNREADKEFIQSNKKFPSDDSKDRLYKHRLETAKSFYFQGDHLAALEWIELASRVKNTGELNALKADTYRQLGDYSKAEVFYKRAAPFAKSNGYVYEARAWNFTLAGDGKGAEEALKKAIASAPKDPRYWVALALHYKRQEKIIEAMDALGRARELCVDKESIERYNEIFPLNFFDYSPAAGLGLDGIGIPAALAAFGETGKRISNTESIVRGLNIQKIGEDQYSLYMPVKSTRYSKYGVRTNVYSQYVPPFSLYYQKHESLEARRNTDTTYDTDFQQFSLEMQKWMKLGPTMRLGLLPYLRRTDFSGIQSHNVAVHGTDYKSDEWSTGVKFNLQPINGKYVVETGVGLGRTTEHQSKKKFQTFNYDARLFVLPANFIAGDLSVARFHSPDDPGGGKLVRSEYRGGLNFLFMERSSFGLSYKLISYNDELKGGDKVTTNFTEPRIDLKVWADDLVGAELAGYKFNNEKYDAYNYTTYEGALVFVPRWQGQRRLLKYKNPTPYSLPMEMRIGYALTNFSDKNIPTNDRISGGEKFRAVTYGLKLFW